VGSETRRREKKRKKGKATKPRSEQARQNPSPQTTKQGLSLPSAHKPDDVESPRANTRRGKGKGGGGGRAAKKEKGEGKEKGRARPPQEVKTA
jgi:hypothetical protein